MLEAKCPAPLKRVGKILSTEELDQRGNTSDQSLPANGQGKAAEGQPHSKTLARYTKRRIFPPGFWRAAVLLPPGEPVCPAAATGLDFCHDAANHNSIGPG